MIGNQQIVYAFEKTFFCKKKQFHNIMWSAFFSFNRIAQCKFNFANRLIEHYHKNVKIMKRLFFLIVSFVYATTLFANPIDETTALQVAENFYQINFPNPKRSQVGFTLAYKCTSKQTGTKKSGIIDAYYFVYNIGNSGFIMISGDDSAMPILGYSTESTFNPDKIPQNVAKWFEGYKKQIRYIADNKIKPSSEVKNTWTKILNGETLRKKRSSVSPLMQTKWGQDPYVNDLCPYDYSYFENAVTGCPATAMAQIMKFWEYPVKGSGFHSYSHIKYGTLSANFGTTTYEWDNMPNEISSENLAVATLMYHCGVAVEMNYNVAAEGGSGSYVIKDKYSRYPDEQTVEHALVTYFGYENTLEGLERSDYTDYEWINLMKDELNAGRPIQYAGYGQGGHTFVCDGYDNNGFFHINWGWNGYLDGYYSLDNLAPGTGGTGSGAGHYNDGQQALIGIKPPDVSLDYELEIYDDVVADKSTIYYGESFTITTDILNDGTTTFNGDFCAAAFDESGKFVDYIEIKNDWTLASGYHYTNGISFTTDGLLSLLPGKYEIYVFCRPVDGNWEGLIADYLSFTSNYTTIEVTNENDFSLYASMYLTPADNIYSGQSFSVWLDVANYFDEQFTGTIDVSLYTLEGDFAANIEEKNDMTLSANSHYTDGLTFSTSNLEIEPGTYLLAVMHKWDGYDWELTGSTTDYINPIKVIVQAPPYQADIYENNDELEYAYTLPVNYTSNTANIETTGANAHVGNDYDYYKIDFESGYSYTISARLHDEYDSGNGYEYSLDALFSYSTDGTNWSDAYDDVWDNDLTIDGSGSLYFTTSPFFLGETGTYLLDINITRSELTSLSASTDNISIGAANNSRLKIYPNPASQFINLESESVPIKQIDLFDISGRLIMSKQNINSKTWKIPVNNYDSGTYLIVIKGSEFVQQKQIIISK